jgi:predicted PurR-regulated permease PerM
MSAPSSASMQSFAHTLRRLADSMEQGAPEEDSPRSPRLPTAALATGSTFDEAAGAVLRLCTLLDMHAGNKAPVEEEAGELPTEAAAQGRGWKRFTPAGLANLRAHFASFDVDESGQLSFIEIDRMLKGIGLGEDVRKQIAMALRDADDSDQPDGVDFNEFVQWLNATFDDHYSEESALQLPEDEIAALEAMQTSLRKVGFGGTTWRTFENTIWLLTQGVMIMVGSTIFVGIVYFRFILVPMTMAYFLTFLIGPIIDVMAQRPLICIGRVFCRINKLPPPAAAAEWKAKHGEKRPLPHVSELDYPYDSGAGVCCHSRPPPSKLDALDMTDQVNRTMHQWATVGKLPFPLALALTLVVIVTGFRFAFLLISHDVQMVLQDAEFMDAFENLLEGAAKRLKNEFGVIIAEFQPSSIRKQLEGNKTCVYNPDGEVDGDGMDMDDIMTVEVRTANGTECIQVQEFSSDQFSELMAPYLAMANDVGLTLLLCLYLLSARSTRGEFDHHRATHAAGQLTVMEKIEVMNRNYVLLKTKLSALTAALVMILLGVLSVKLWFIWGLLTFALNFIPNVGSMIAMVLPVPVILVDEQLGVARQAGAILLPALVQAYVGNVLEPQLFGKSLNLTAISVLIGLVFWSAIWGMCGAVLSVPMLGVMKILLDETDYPLAKRLLGLMREDSTIDEEAMSRAMVRELSGYQQEHSYSVAGKNVNENGDDTPNPLRERDTDAFDAKV